MKIVNQMIPHQPKILIGCPTFDRYIYCLKEYLTAIKTLNYENYDILLVDNSMDNNYYDKLKSLGLNVIKDVYKETARDRIVSSRNILRQYALDNNYDYLLSLEQDVIPPNDVIEKLLSHNKKIVSGVYFNLMKLENSTEPKPMLWRDYNITTNRMIFLTDEEILKPQILELSACGLGCLLIHKSVLEKIKFRYSVEKEGFDDVWFSHDCRALNFSIYVDTSIRCKHITVKNKWGDIKL